MKISYKQLLLILTTLYSATAYPLRGRWASAAIGYSAGKNSSGNTIDSMTQKQVNRHEKEINKLNAKLEKMEKKQNIYGMVNMKLLIKQDYFFQY